MPRFEPIPETPLQYAVNTGTPVIQVDEVTYYAVADAVWFVSASPTGPWTGRSRARGHLLDSAELTALQRDLRQGVQLHG